MEIVQTAFGATGHVGFAQECARALLIFVYGWVAVRFLGRRIFGKWAALDIIVSIIIGSNLSRALTGSAPLFGTLGATGLMLVFHWVLAQAAARSSLMSRLLEGRPVRLVVDGKADRKSMRRWSISEADLQEALRRRSMQSEAEIREGVLEPSGVVSLLK